jgi:hypothetical protein
MVIITPGKKSSNRVGSPGADRMMVAIVVPRSRSLAIPGMLRWTSRSI